MTPQNPVTSPPDTLVIILAARISEWGTKGELVQGYFNPANRFRHIQILSLVPDQVDDAVLEYLCADASWRYTSLALISPANMVKTGGFAPGPVRSFLNRQALPLITASRPVIRAYGDGIAGMVAAQLGDLLECRAIASIHTTATIRPDAPGRSLKMLLFDAMDARARGFAHEHLDALAPVYSPALVAIAPAWHGKTHVIPNAVALPGDAVKQDYNTGPVTRLLTVGRMVAGKSPLPILQGLAAMKDWHLTIIGDGPEREDLMEFVKAQDLQDQVTHIPRLDNAALVASLKDYDAFIGYTAYAEIPKTVIEAGLAGLPVILNLPDGDMPPEYEEAPVLWAEGSPESYAVALQVYRDHENERAATGAAMQTHFSHWFDPARAGQAMADLLFASGDSGYSSDGSNT